MQVLNIYEFYYTFYSWQLYAIFYQIFWSTKLLLIPFLFFIFKAITQQSEDGSGGSPFFYKNVTGFIIIFIVFIVGVVPTVNIKMSDSTVNFISCDIQKPVEDVVSLNTTLSSDSIKMPIVPYLLFSLGSGISGAVGSNLSCMQPTVNGLDSITTSPLSMENDPSLKVLYNTYINQCHNQALHFTTNFLNAISPDKALKIHEHYKSIFRGEVSLGDLGGYSKDKAGVIAAFKDHLMSNNDFLNQIVYSDDPVKKLNEIGNIKGLHSIKDQGILADAWDIIMATTPFGAAQEFHSTWKLSESEENWIRANLPLIMKLKQSEVEYLGSSRLGGKSLVNRQHDDHPSCNITSASESLGDDPVSCFTCDEMAEAVLGEVSLHVAAEQVEKQIRNNLDSANTSHPVIVRPSKAEIYNQLVKSIGIKGNNKQQENAIKKALLSDQIGFTYTDKIYIDENGNLQPTGIVEKIARKMLSNYPDEAGYLSATQTNPRSVLDAGNRDSFVNATQTGLYVTSAILSKGETIAKSIDKWISIQLTNSLMLQILPMILMLYTLFWLPFMVLSMYDPKTLLKGAGVFLVIRLTPLFVIVVTSSTAELSSMLGYNPIESILIELAASVISVSMPVILLSFMAQAFGSSMSGAFMGAAATGGAAIAGMGSGRIGGRKGGSGNNGNDGKDGDKGSPETGSKKPEEKGSQ